MSPFGTHTCLKDGKFVLLGEIDVVKKTYIQKWRNCDGVCIDATKKCNGTCELWLQCESDDGSCIFLSDQSSSVKDCNGKCIPKENLCDGKCLNPMCKQDGKCVDMFNLEEAGDFFKNCEGACMKAIEKCNGKCEDDQCEGKDGSCLPYICNNWWIV